MTTLSRRAGQLLKTESFMDITFGKCRKDCYNKIENPKGLINLGTAENKLVFDLLKEKFSKINVDEILPEYSYYGTNFIPRFRHAMTKFLNHYMKPAEPVDPFNLRALSGMSTIINVLGYLLCDPGDGILIPTPYFGGFHWNLTSRAVDAIPVPVDLYSKLDPEGNLQYELTVEKLEESFDKATKQKDTKEKKKKLLKDRWEKLNYNDYNMKFDVKLMYGSAFLELIKNALENQEFSKYDLSLASFPKNICIRGLLLTNPHNPLGDVYTEKVIRDCMAFAHRHSLHVIADEIYMLSIFEEGHPPMKNVLSLKDIPDKEHLHVAWSFSKDFGLSGMSCSVIHSHNKEVLNALDKIGSFHTLPSITQLQMASIISDLDWLDKVFIPTNHSRLRECHGILCGFLERMKIPFLKRGSGLFVWADFREFISPLTSEGEEDFCQKVLDGGVYIAPGYEFYSADPGWCRIIFSVPPATLKVALERFEQVINNFRQLKI